MTEHTLAINRSRTMRRPNRRLLQIRKSNLLVAYLAKEGFKTIVLNDGSNAVETIKASDPVFVILDLMLPVKDGLTICREVRQFSTVPILMLTARVDEIDRLLGLEMGLMTMSANLSCPAKW